MRYSKETIEAIKKQINLLDVISEYASDIRRVSDTVWSCKCPHPNHNDSTASFRIWHENNRWTWACMGCHSGKKDMKHEHKNYGSDVIAFMQWIYNAHNKNLSFGEAVKLLANKYHIKLEEESTSHLFVYKINRALAKAYHSNLTSKAKQYLMNRGLSEEDINEWNIGYTVEKECSQLTERITFPLINYEMKYVGFCNRLLSDGPQVKYINSKNSEVFNKSKFFFNEHQLDTNFKEIRITEGPMDVILAHKYGVKNMVGLMGVALTDDKIKVIKALNMKPVFCLDGDDAGKKAAIRSLELLAKHDIYGKVFILPDNKDMAELALGLKDNLEDYISTHAKPYWQYKMEESASVYDTLITEARNKILSDVNLAAKMALTEEDKIIMKSFVLERMGIVL